MSTYTYTENNNAISFGQIVQGPTGAKGHTGPAGFTGAQGAAGSQGNSGPDNTRKTDVSFCDAQTPAYRRISGDGAQLVGHVISNGLDGLTSVKVVVGADTGDTICQAGLLLVNHTTENNTAADTVTIATKFFEIKGSGKQKDYIIVDLDIDASLWPVGEDVLGLWAYIEAPKGAQKSFFTKVVQDTSAQSAVILKEELKAKYAVNRGAIYDNLETKYGITPKGDTLEGKQVLKDEQQARELKLQRDKEIIQREEDEAALAENRRARDMSPKLSQSSPTSGGTGDSGIKTGGPGNCVTGTEDACQGDGGTPTKTDGGTLLGSTDTKVEGAPSTLPPADEGTLLVASDIYLNVAYLQFC